MKHFCTTCKNGFDEKPYVKREKPQGGEAFCTKECHEKWFKKNFPEFCIVRSPNRRYRGVRINKPH